MTDQKTSDPVSSLAEQALIQARARFGSIDTTAEAEPEPQKKKPGRKAAVTTSSTLQDLEKTLWGIADKLRANMDAAEYKHIVLGLIFLKYISDSFAGRRAELERRFADADADADDDYYLLAATVGGGTLKELRMLAAAHGIGVIQRAVQSPTESQILIPARERSEIDWDICSRLTEENGDFAEFIGRIRRFHQTSELSVKEWEACA